MPKQKRKETLFIRRYKRANQIFFKNFLNMRIYIYYIERNLVYLNLVNFNFYAEYYRNNRSCELASPEAEIN